MTEEQNWPDLEHCKKLRDAGWTIPTIAVYYKDPAYQDFIRCLREIYPLVEQYEWYPAPLLTELLRGLPSGSKVLKIVEEYCVTGNYVNEDGDPATKGLKGLNPCNAAVDLWCWLEERKKGGDACEGCVQKGEA